jgi:hypothetical protein
MPNASVHFTVHSIDSFPLTFLPHRNTKKSLRTCSLFFAQQLQTSREVCSRRDAQIRLAPAQAAQRRNAPCLFEAVAQKIENRFLTIIYVFLFSLAPCQK